MMFEAVESRAPASRRDDIGRRKTT